MRIFLTLAMILPSWKCFACPDFPLSFNAPGTSFYGERLTLKGTTHGAAYVTDDGDELYFNQVKKKWCISSKGVETCLDKSTQGFEMTDSKTGKSPIAKIMLGNDGSLIEKSIKSDGSIDNTKPYLVIIDQSLVTIPKCIDLEKSEPCPKGYEGSLKIAMMDPKLGQIGEANLKTKMGKLKDDGSVRFPVFRGLELAPKDPAAVAPGIPALSGHSLTKTGNCGFGNVSDYRPGSASGGTDDPGTH